MSTPKSPTAMVGLDGKFAVVARFQLVNQAPSGKSRLYQFAISPVAGSILEDAKGYLGNITYFS